MNSRANPVTRFLSYFQTLGNELPHKSDYIIAEKNISNPRNKYRLYKVSKICLFEKKVMTKQIPTHPAISKSIERGITRALSTSFFLTVFF